MDCTWNVWRARVALLMWSLPCVRHKMALCSNNMSKRLSISLWTAWSNNVAYVSDQEFHLNCKQCFFKVFKGVVVEVCGVNTIFPSTVCLIPWTDFHKSASFSPCVLNFAVFISPWNLCGLYKPILSSIFLSQQCCEIYFISLAVVNP